MDHKIQVGKKQINTLGIMKSQLTTSLRKRKSINKAITYMTFNK
ncbi:hypothetical protein FEM08_03500 [Flavobacterium gilvum]|nr:hypothetical protein FEM08_03500 [Flavobacterium gilvum]